MKPIRQFEVEAIVRKAFIEDQRPIENIKAIISCYSDGQVSLECDFITINNISQKMIIEERGIKEIISPLPPDDLWSMFALLEAEMLETREVPPYRGDYILEGQTPEGFLISANTSIGTKFNQEGIKLNFFSSETDVEGQPRKQIGLRDLQIDYNAIIKPGFIKQIQYGLTDLDFRDNFTASFLEDQAQLRIKDIPIIDCNQNDNIAKLKSEMLLCNIPLPKNEIAQQNHYDTSSKLYAAYSTWFQMLLTFSSGHQVRNIYRIETTQASDGAEKVVEYWTGGYFPKKSGLSLIQGIDISTFIIQVANQVTEDIFGAMGLGLSLSWYIQSFDTTMLPTQCLFIYTAIETLNSNFPKEKLTIKSDNKTHINLNYKAQKKIESIRDNIKKLCLFYQDCIAKESNDIDNNDIEKTNKRKFDSILQRISQGCDSLFNMIPDPHKKSYNTFNEILESILIHYKVPYKDLFPDLDIKTVRNQLIHTGFYTNQDQEAGTFYLKLRSLFNRIVLCILEYKGSFFESTLTAEHGTYDVIFHSPLI